MVNPAEVGVISLEGAGFVQKPIGGFKSGEFARLYNCELTSYGSIKRRRGIANADVFPTTFQDKHRFLGSWGQYGIFGPRIDNTNDARAYSFGSGQPALSYDTPDPNACKILNSDGTLLIDAFTYNDAFDDKNWHPFVIEGFQRYNKHNYWIGCGVLSSVSAVPAYTYRKAVVWVAKRNDANGDYLDSLDMPDAAPGPTGDKYDLKVVGEIDVIGDTTDTASILPEVVTNGNAWPVITHFIHKDRLWIVTPTQLLFSKPTDPFEFRVSQDGGFVSMADAEINWATPVGDSIYIFSDSKIDVHTYSDSPNTDGQTSRISTALGADCAAEHNNDVYFAKYNALYQISGTRIEKVMDLALKVEGGLTDACGQNNLSKYYRITSYYNYLIVGHVARTYAPANPAGENVLGANKNSMYYRGYSAQYAPCPDLTVRNDGFGWKIPTTFFMINTDTGAVSEFGFHPQFEKRDQSAIFEVSVVTNENSENQQTLFIGCLDRDSVLTAKGAAGARMAFFYLYPPTYMDDGILGNYARDAYYDGNWPGAGVSHPATTYSRFTLRDIAPDGMEYDIKKFRNLLCEAYIKDKPIKFSFSYDDSAITDPVEVGPSSTGVPPQGYRIGLNQRSRAINIDMIDDPDDAFTSARWEIFDLRLLWTYSQRGPSRYSGFGP